HRPRPAAGRHRHGRLDRRARVARGRVHGTHRRQCGLHRGRKPVTAVTTVPAQLTTEPRARFRDLLAAEWLKFWSLRSSPWGLLAGALAVLGLNGGQAWDHWRYWRQAGESPARFIADGLPLQDAFTTNAGIVMMIAAAAIGTLAITGEYGTGLIRTTFTAVPARRSVLAAKVAVLTVIMTGFGAVVAAASF